MKTVAQTVIEADHFYTIAAHTGNVIQAVEGAKEGGTVRLGKYLRPDGSPWRGRSAWHGAAAGSWGIGSFRFVSCGVQALPRGEQSAFGACAGDGMLRRAWKAARRQAPGP